MESNFSNTDAVAALSSDDPDAFRALVEHYQHALFGFLGRMGFAQADAEDIAQDVFIKLWLSRARYNADTAQVSTWLFTIARNTAVNRLKRVSCRQIPLHEVEIETQWAIQQGDMDISAVYNCCGTPDSVYRAGAADCYDRPIACVCYRALRWNLDFFYFRCMAYSKIVAILPDQCLANQRRLYSCLSSLCNNHSSFNGDMGSKESG